MHYIILKDVSSIFIELNFLKPNQRSETKLRNKLYRHGYSFNIIDRAVKDLAVYSDGK